MKVIFAFIGAIMLNTSVCIAQDVNNYDANGKRHGVWQKFYPQTKQLRYQGAFNHGKEVGTFKFYCDECGEQPSVIKEFKDNDTAHVQYFTIKGKLVSEGKMIGKNRQGEWLSYHKKSNEVMTRENYVDNKLQGIVTVYYPNGVVTETTNYDQGIKQGESKNYSVDGVLLNELTYVDDQLHGAVKYYDSNGQVTIAGQYKKGKKEGMWYYYKNGKLEREEKYPKPLNTFKEQN